MAEAATQVFAPRRTKDAPNMLLAEAGTGIGKTLAYLVARVALGGGDRAARSGSRPSPRRCSGSSTPKGRGCSPTPRSARGKIVVRKGRENYLCLLNLEDALQGAFAGRAAILAQLVGRWAAYRKDGDMVGGDLPGWLPSLFRRAGATALTDRRGECVYAGCPHYRRCFIERAERAGREADIVIANHALVMINAARGARGLADSGSCSTRAIICSTRRIRPSRSRSAGRTRSRCGAGSSGRKAVARAAARACGAADGRRVLRRGRRRRRSRRRSRRRGRCHRTAGCSGIVEGSPFGPVEALLGEVRGTVYARAKAQDAGYGLETELAEPDGALVAAAAKALESARGAAEAACGARAGGWKRCSRMRRTGSIRRRGRGSRARSTGSRGGAKSCSAWIALLARVGGAADPEFVDWLAIERVEGREFDIAIHRHWLDPTKPLAGAVLRQAHGVLVTSATLRGGDGSWERAEARTGAAHLDCNVGRFEADSPFDYAACSEVLIVTDVKQGDLAGLAGAYARLIEAAGGGTLGLFTAIQRLKGGPCAHRRPAGARRPAAARAACRPDRSGHLGRHLPRRSADVAARHRRASRRRRCARQIAAAGGDGARAMAAADGASCGAADGGRGSAYDDAVVRARLAQAFGRLIRREGDRGTFVILSAAMPSRLLSAFPAGVPIRRVPLDEAIAHVAAAGTVSPVTNPEAAECERSTY